jgi:hypothetical protein
LNYTALFGRIFAEPPTYEELKNRTPKLSPLFELNQKSDDTKNPLGRPEHIRVITVYIR